MSNAKRIQDMVNNEKQERTDYWALNKGRLLMKKKEISRKKERSVNPPVEKEKKRKKPPPTKQSYVNITCDIKELTKEQEKDEWIRRIWKVANGEKGVKHWKVRDEQDALLVGRITGVIVKDIRDEIGQTRSKALESAG